jgi:hydroxypyruvate isomerase
MVKLAANLSMMFTELPFLDRFAAAAEAGFTAVECLFPYEAPATTVAERARSNGVEVVLFNFPAGNWNGGERGIAALPDRLQDFRDSAQRALDYTTTIGCPRLHLMAGKIGEGSREKARETFIENVAYAADLMAAAGIDVMLEPLNTRVDVPGYFYDTTEAALGIIDAVGRTNVKLQYDIYHMQIMEGDLARTIERLLPRIGHMQLADNPGRNEPGTGEINYPWLLERIDATGYRGWIGCEYKPLTGTVDGLGWARNYLGRAASGAE